MSTNHSYNNYNTQAKSILIIGVILFLATLGLETRGVLSSVWSMGLLVTIIVVVIIGLLIISNRAANNGEDN